MILAAYTWFLSLGFEVVYVVTCNVGFALVEFITDPENG